MWLKIPAEEELAELEAEGESLGPKRSVDRDENEEEEAAVEAGFLASIVPWKSKKWIRWHT